jgi:hypothetical protein
LALIAITGSILDACEAGIKPATIPIILEIVRPKMILFEERTISKLPRSIKLAKYTRISPNKPPIKQRNMASNKNWNNIK